jgi:hypothetical protein
MNVEGCNSSRCFAAQPNRSVENRVPYSREALRQDLLRVRNAWEQCQASRDRNAIYEYLSAVFGLVMWWATENRAISRARWALRLWNIWSSDRDEPFAAIIRCTSDPAKVDSIVAGAFTSLASYQQSVQFHADIDWLISQWPNLIIACGATFSSPLCCIHSPWMSLRASRVVLVD